MRPELSSATITPRVNEAAGVSEGGVEAPPRCVRRCAPWRVMKNLDVARLLNAFGPGAWGAGFRFYEERMSRRNSVHSLRVKSRTGPWPSCFVSRTPMVQPDERPTSTHPESGRCGWTCVSRCTAVSRHDRMSRRNSVHSLEVNSRMGPRPLCFVSRTAMVPWAERPTSTHSVLGLLWLDLRQALYCCFTCRALPVHSADRPYPRGARGSLARGGWPVGGGR